MTDGGTDVACDSRRGRRSLSQDTSRARNPAWLLARSRARRVLIPGLMRTFLSLAFLVVSLGACITEDDTIPPDPVEEELPDEVSDDGRVLVDPRAEPPVPTGEQCVSAIDKDDSMGCTP